MDYGSLPPEINSARIYAGPGAGSLLVAASAWQEVAAELSSAADSYKSVLSGLTSGSWTGPSAAAMAAAAAPYVSWLNATAGQAQEAAAQATAAAGAYETAYAATVPPPVIAANRSLLAILVATNLLGQNAPAIAATEFHYAEMWAQDAAAMYGYAGASAAATKVTPYTMPPQTTNPTGGLANQAAAATQAVGASVGTDSETIMSAGPQLLTATPSALQDLATSAGGSTASSSSSSSLSSLSSLNSLSSLSMPARMAMMPMSTLTRMFMTGGSSTARAAATGAVMGEVAKGELAATTAAATGASTGTVNLTGLTGLGGGAGSAMSAGLGKAVSVGALSVPSAWTGAVPAMTPAAAAFPAAGTGAIPAIPAGAHAAMPPMMPITNMSGRGVSTGPARYDFRPIVVPRSPAAG